jgi:hypothetical protein
LGKDGWIPHSEKNVQLNKYKDFEFEPRIWATWEAEAEDGKFEASLGNLERPCLNIRFKKAEYVAQW